METIYALVIILTGTLVPDADAPDGILSGEVENTTTVYYSSMEACEQGYQNAVATYGELVVEGLDSKIEVKPCEGIQVVQ